MVRREIIDYTLVLQDSQHVNLNSRPYLTPARVYTVGTPKLRKYFIIYNLK